MWWDSKGVIYYDVLKQGQTVTAALYCEQMDKLNTTLQKIRPALVNKSNVILQHDNAQPHVADITRKKIQDLSWDVLLHPPYSLDLVPSNFHLFRFLETQLGNKKFDNSTKTEIGSFGVLRI